MLRLPLTRARALALAPRALSTHAPLRAKAPLSQGHTTSKQSDPVHKDKDVQSASARAGFDSRAHAESDPAGAPAGYDAARQGSAGGEVHKTGAQMENRGSDAEGALKDQVGGQPEGGGVQMGHEEESAGGSRPDRIKQTLKGFAGLRQQHDEGRDYHTSARSRKLHTSAAARAVSASPEAARQPKHDVAGEQSGHLRHKAAGAADSGRAGNAAPEPTLPSKSKHKGAAGSPSEAKAASSKRLDPSLSGGKIQNESKAKQRGLHTSARVSSVAAPGTEGKQPNEQTSPDAGAAGAPGKKSGSVEGKTGSDSEAKAASAKELDPSLSGGKIQNESKAEYPKGKRGLHTSARVSSVAAPGTEGKQPNEQTSPDAGAAGAPGKKSGSVEGKTDSHSEAKAASAKKLDPSLSGGKIQNESKSEYPKGKRGLHTSAAASAAKPPGGYTRAHDHEAAQQGYNTPPEALPQHLESDYGPGAQRSAEGMTPTSESGYSSSARDPPNEALRQRVLDGDMPEKNPQPHAEMGRKGNFEAWKDRKV